MIQGIGTDLVELQRFQHMNLDRLTLRLLTPRERACLPERQERKIEFLAGRFAAKEAFSKAWGTGIGADLALHDIEVIPDHKRKPEIWISPALQKSREHAEQLRFHLSITHTATYAMAMVIIEQFA